MNDLRFARRLAAFGLAALFGARGLGCAYRTPDVHIPVSLPAIDPARIDVEKVTVVDEARGAPPVDDAVVRDLRKDTLDVLTKAVSAHGDRDVHSGVAAKAKVDVHLYAHGGLDTAVKEDGCAAVGYAGAPAGQDIGWEQIGVDITLDVEGQTYRGHGSAEKAGSIYAEARRRALAVALDRALLAARPATSPGGS